MEKVKCQMGHSVILILFQEYKSKRASAKDVQLVQNNICPYHKLILWILRLEKMWVLPLQCDMGHRE